MEVTAHAGKHCVMLKLNVCATYSPDYPQPFIKWNPDNIDRKENNGGVNSSSSKQLYCFISCYMPIETSAWS
jgi:hypothetical protein